MARRKGHDAQVDPFTAGEPTLPWDEPGAFEGLFGDGDSGVEACALDEGPYDGPTKTPNAYRAPDSRGADADRPPRPDGARERKRRERSERAAERRARKAAPQDKRPRPRSFGIIRAVFIFLILVNALPLVVEAVEQVVSAISQNNAPDPDATDPDATAVPSFDGDGIEPEIDRSPLDEDELACVEAADAYLREITDEQGHERTALAEALDRYLSDYVGYSCEGLGIDAGAYADWVLSNFSYRITSCYARPDEGTASLYLYTWCPDTFSVVSTARQSVCSYLEEMGLGDDRGARPLTEEEQDDVRRLFAEAIENAEMESEAFLGFDLALQDGTWALDVAQAQYQLGISLGY